MKVLGQKNSLVSQNFSESPESEVSPCSLSSASSARQTIRIHKSPNPNRQLQRGSSPAAACKGAQLRPRPKVKLIPPSRPSCALPAARSEHGKSLALKSADSKGCHVVRWTSNQRALQEETELTECAPPEIVEKGTLVCEGNHLNKVPRAKDWHVPSLVKTTGRLQFVIVPNLVIEDESDDCKLPNNCDKRQARWLGAMRMSNVK